ncbi:hypothetical protein LTS08_005213 [Lithohypha guttulata]|nr:hypothetical protein LTS08_005213 [Lithohypha guttulata]
MTKVVEEIDAAGKEGQLSTPVSYKESTTSLPYFNAVLKEAMRIHPSVGFLMERHVPPEGVEISSQFIPGGTIVGINPWVTNRNESVFPDPDEFKPERWLEATESQMKQMDDIFELNFGGGSRKCIGRNISMIEMQKVLPELLRRYTVTLTHPDKDWRICNHWFVQQEGVICNLTRR